MILIGLPADFHRSDWPNAGAGLGLRASVIGFRLQPFKDMPLTKKISIKVSFPKGTEFESFRVETDIVWKDVYFWEGWEEYQYALKFVKLLTGYYLKFKTRLCQRFGAEEAPTQIRNIGAST
jgi:hypothetical protein